MQEDHLIVRLAKDERSLLLEHFALADHIRGALEGADKATVYLPLTRSEADDLREQAGELFQSIGLGPDNLPTVEGRHLDQLIDKLYSG
jgi:hypothetical protein